MRFNQKAIDLNPRNVMAWANLGWSYGELGDHQEVAEAYFKALSLTDDPDITSAVKDTLKAVGRGQIEL